jgi:lysozyme family protein
MADHKKVISFFMKWEGGLSRDGNDSASRFPCRTPYNGYNGWHTNKGITYAVWVSYFGKDQDARFFEMSEADVEHIFKAGYWDKVKGDEIDHESIAACMVSWAWGSGAGTSIKMMQKIVGTKVDGKLGAITIGAINKRIDEDVNAFFNECVEARRKFFMSISEPGTPNAKFRRGWLNRLNDFTLKFKP